MRVVNSELQKYANRMLWVECPECETTGPLSATEADAIDNWNRLSIAMEWARLLVAADEAHPGFAASVLAAGKAATT